MAKADLRKAETDGWRQHVGAAIQRAVSLRGWTLKEFAAAVGRDERQCARWITGDERPQLDTLFAVDSFRQPLIVALAEAAGEGVEIETTVRITHRRVA
jgi:hypothetical protein